MVCAGFPRILTTVPLPLGFLATQPSSVLPQMQEEHIIRVFVSKKNKNYDISTFRLALLVSKTFRKGRTDS